MKESKAIEFIKSEGLEEKFKKFKEVPEVEFKVSESTAFDFKINVYINGDYIDNMSFDIYSIYSLKIYRFNNMIEKVYKELGVKASQEEMRDTTIKKYGFEINSVIDDWGVAYSYGYLYAIESNHSSNNIEKTKLVYNAISVHREYIKEAFGVKEQNE